MGLAVATSLVAAVGCARARPQAAPPPPPALEVPVVPPRVLAPVNVEAEATGQEGDPSAQGARRTPRRPRSEPASQRPADSSAPEPQRPEPAQAEPQAGAEKPPNEASAAQHPAVPPRDDAEASRHIREVLGRANADLARVNVPRLGADARTQYETARRFIDQAEGALHARNYLFARFLADKAEALARGLQGR